MAGTQTTKDRKAVLAALESLANERFTEDDITFEGTKLIIPAGMTAHRAIETLERYIAQQETPTTFTRTYQYRPWDGAAAFERAVKHLTGTVGIQTRTQTFFGSKPPERLNIKVGVNESMDVPWGNVYIELFEGQAHLGIEEHDEYGALFHIEITCPRKYRAAVEGLFQLIEQELVENSIYRGKAFDGQEMPEFVDLAGVDPTQVVYSQEVQEQLQANVWSLLDYSDAMRAEGIPLKRAALFHGEYGTGKTLAAFLTALKAQTNGWTFVYCRPGKDNLELVMQTARLYQPSVVFFEDVDTVSNATVAEPGNKSDAISRLLDTFDGITAKGTELIAILTTNHPEKIHKGMVRPGRLDAVIEFTALDPEGYEQLIRRVVGEDRLDDDLDWEAIAESLEGFVPAFVREVVDRTRRYAMSRNGGVLPDKLTTSDFVQAANGLRPQLAMMQEALEGTTIDPLSVSFMELIRPAATDAVKDAAKALEWIERNGEFALDANEK